MSEEQPVSAIPDEDLPEELRPTDDNPLAKPLTDEDEPRSREELDVLGGVDPGDLDAEEGAARGRDASDSDG